jgi:hypothetical protein
MNFRITNPVTASCSVAGITLFTSLLLATPFLVIPAGILAIVARTKPVNQFSRLSPLMLALDAALLLALLTLLY